MIIYDFRNQSLIDFNQILIGLFFLAFGLFAFLLLPKYKPSTKQNWYTDFFGLTKDDIANKTFMFPKAAKLMGIMAFIGAGLIFFMQTKDYIYVNNISYFERIKSFSSRIDSVKTNSLFGMDYMTIHIKDKTFNFNIDSRYIANRKLLTNDSIKIDYFETKAEKNQDFEIIMIELK